MDRSKAYEILKSLNEKEYVTARDISESCEISIKTIRNRITDINKMLVYQKVGCIESRPHYGYKLRVHNNVKFKEFLENFTEAKQAVPENPQERAFGVLSILLNQRDCIVMETIAARLYISRTSISNTMREIEGMLEEYNLTLVRKSHNGIMIAGKEQDKRSLMNSLIEKDVYFYESQNPITIKVIQDMLKKIIQRNTEITIYSAAFDKLVVSVFVFTQRILSGFYIDTDYDREEVDHIDDNTLVVTDQILKALEAMGITIAEEKYSAEFSFLAILFQSQQTMITKNQFSGTMIIPVHIQEKVSTMLEGIYKEFGVDLRSNLELRMSLYTHLIPFDIRMKYNIPITNPQKLDIKEKYPLSYAMASYAFAAIQDQYAKLITEDEITYITPFIELFTGEEEKFKHKKRILIICSAGRASSQLLAFKFMREFEPFISSIEMRNMHNFTQENLDSYDFIFSTIPIDVKGKHIYYINPYLTKNDLYKVKDILIHNDYDSSLLEFYKKELFFNCVEGKTRQEVIHNICCRMQKHYDKPIGMLEEKILERENLYPTDYGNFIAFPHPMEACTEETFISVSVLKDAVKWSEKRVRIVFVISYGKGYVEEEKIKNLNTLTFRLFSNREAVKRILENPVYETVIEQLIG